MGSVVLIEQEAKGPEMDALLEPYFTRTTDPPPSTDGTEQINLIWVEPNDWHDLQKRSKKPAILRVHRPLQRPTAATVATTKKINNSAC